MKTGYAFCFGCPHHTLQETVPMMPLRNLTTNPYCWWMWSPWKGFHPPNQVKWKIIINLKPTTNCLLYPYFERYHFSREFPQWPITMCTWGDLGDIRCLTCDLVRWLYGATLWLRRANIEFGGWVEDLSTLQHFALFTRKTTRTG